MRWRHAEGLDDVRIGADGFALMALSAAAGVASLGLTLAAALALVLRAALRTPAGAAIEGAAGGARVLVLGQRLAPGAVPGAGFRARLDRATALTRVAPIAEIIVLGGRTGPDPITEAAAGAAYLRAAGVAHHTIRLEDRSRHTLENLRFYRSGFTPPPGPTVLVTSRFHLARSMLLARGLGLAPLPCAAEPRLRVADLPRCVAEAVLIHWYLTGLWFARLTGARRIAERLT